MDINIYFRKINYHTGIAPPTEGGGWGGALSDLKIYLK
jgi:hypothetical protein